MTCLPSSIFFSNEPIWLAHHSKKNKAMKAPKNKRFYFEVYLDERTTTFAKVYIYGIKVMCYWELFGEHVMNGNSLLWSLAPTPKKNRKKLHEKSIVHCPIGKWRVHSPHETQLEKENTTSSVTHKIKKEGPFTPWHVLLISCMEILFLKLAAIIFGLDQ